MKILNLYAGIGGNRKLWGDEHEVTAVEINTNKVPLWTWSFVVALALILLYLVFFRKQEIVEKEVEKDE